ncbi:hypothetical protein Dimus_038277 [Dionaea muscipula]
MEWNANCALKSLKDTRVGGYYEKGSAVQIAKPRKKAMTSAYLKFFETAADGKSRSCKFCGQTYSIATATGNLGRHLSSRHPGYDKSGDSITGTALQSSGSTAVLKPQSGAKAPKVDLDGVNWLLLKWLSLASLPPTILDDGLLANSLKILNPSIEIWSSEKFQPVLFGVFRSMQENVRTTLDQISSKVALAIEFWSSYEQITYMGVTCQWIDDNWSFQKVLLDICRVPYPCGGSEIYTCLVKIIKMFHIQDKILACTHDNSPSAMLACHTLGEDADAHKMGPFCFIPCAARTLNMIIEDGLGPAKALISKARDFVMEMNTSSDISKDFLHFTTAYQEGSWKIPLDVSAVWSGQYQMLDLIHKVNSFFDCTLFISSIKEDCESFSCRLLSVQLVIICLREVCAAPIYFCLQASKSVDAVARKYEETLANRMLLNSVEKNAVSIMHEYLEPFYKTTNNLCAEKVLTLGLVLFFMDHISEMIAPCKGSLHFPDWLKSVAQDMAEKALAYTNQVCNIFTYISVVLDPRIKGELIPESLNVEKNIEEARTHFLRTYSSHHFLPLSTAEYGDGTSMSFAEEIARKKRKASTGSPTDELTLYLSEPLAPISTDAMEWWKINSTRYPRLSLMARDFLAVQATSVAPEELFCFKGAEIERQRFGIPHEYAQVCLCVKSWIESGHMFKCTEIDYDRLVGIAAESRGLTVCRTKNKKGIDHV